MDLLELYDRIRTWEDLHTEFKQTDIAADELAAALVAFANTDGGQLIFGVDKNHQIVGVPDPDRLMQRIDQVAYNNCEPHVNIVQETVQDEQGRIVIVVNIPKGDERPYRTHRGDFSIRTTSGRRRASRQELLRLFQSSESLYYDETPIFRASLTEIDFDKFRHFFENAYDRLPDDSEIVRLLNNMRLAVTHENRHIPTLAGMLCFGREPQRFLPAAQVNAARIPGVSLAAAPSDAKQIAGDLFAMLEDAFRFVRLHLQTTHIIRGIEPEVYPEIAEVALRELLVNALVHRDYTIAAPIRILIFDDRVEYHTPGRLPNSVTVAAILLGAAHVLRNPTLYTMFSRAKLVTHIGSGILRAKQAIESNSKARLQLAEVENEFVVTIFRPTSGETP